jgi:hypothetical protein
MAMANHCGTAPQPAPGHPIAGLFKVRILLPSKHTLVGAVHVWQKFSQGLDRFHSRGFQRLKPIQMIHLRDLIEHRFALGHFNAKVILKALWRDGLGAWGLFGLGHWGSS